MLRNPLPPWEDSGKMRIELDRRSIFALASDTRLEILRSLQPMRRTVTQLAEALDIDKAAIHRHLKKLEEGGLVRRYEDHGFVYYGLSWKARDLMAPNENTRIVISLTSAALVLVAALVVVLAAPALLSMVQPTSAGEGNGPGGSGDFSLGGREPDPREQGATGGSTGGLVGEAVAWLLTLLPAVILPLVAALMLLRAGSLMRRPKQSGQKGASGAPG